MAKNQFKFKLKITGFELEVEGSKEDVAAITATVSNQLKGLTSPPVLSDDIVTEDVDATEIPQQVLPTASKKKVKARHKTTSSNNVKVDKEIPVEFKPNPEKYGTPKLEWKTLQKATWILYVVNQEAKLLELTAAQITETFNKYYRQARTPRPSNVGRDFGKAKLGAKPLVQENNTVSPATWYLTSEGNKFVQNLIEESKK